MSPSSEPPDMSATADLEACAIDSGDVDRRRTLPPEEGKDVDMESEPEEVGVWEDEPWRFEESDEDMEYDEDMDGCWETEGENGGNMDFERESEEEGQIKEELFSHVLKTIRLDVLPEFVLGVRRGCEKFGIKVTDSDDAESVTSSEESGTELGSDKLESEQSSNECTSCDGYGNSSSEPTIGRSSKETSVDGSNYKEQIHGYEEQGSSDKLVDKSCSERREESRKEMSGSEKPDDSRDSEEPDDRRGRQGKIRSVVVGSPIFGSFHVLFPLKFDDRVKWILKVPANGTPKFFDKVSARALRSEAMTISLVQRDTTIPLPQVFEFNDTLDNPLGCPFILMEFISGKPLSEFWHRDTSGTRLRKYRTRILKDVSENMLQLGQFQFGEGGFVEFDDDGEATGVGPFRCVRHHVSIDGESRDKEEMPTFDEVGPFDDPDRFFEALIQQHRKPYSSYGKGALWLLQMFLSWIPDPAKGPSFVLAHPKLDLENIIVTKRGEIKAFIGWSGVCTVPRSIGYETYPRWLIHDYLTVPDEDLNGAVGLEENTAYNPLPSYRNLYDEYLIPPYSRKRAINVTQDSHISLSLYMAVTNPEHTMTVLANFFAVMIQMFGLPPVGADLEYICCGMHEEYLTEKQWAYLRRACKVLFEPVECNRYRFHTVHKWFDRDWPEPPKSPFPYLD